MDNVKMSWSNGIGLDEIPRGKISLPLAISSYHYTAVASPIRSRSETKDIADIEGH